MKKCVIKTNNKEIYNKFNMLYFTDEVLLKNVKFGHLTRILKNINRNKHILDWEKVGDYVVIKKNGPLNFNIYLKEK